jgi:hypothetical protein
MTLMAMDYWLRLTVVTLNSVSLALPILTVMNRARQKETS